MAVVIALLRGINVGGRTTVPMAALRRTLEDAGYSDIETYIQSGNVVFSTTESRTDVLAADLERVIAEQFPVAPRVAIRTAEELRRMVERNPFVARGEAPEHQHVVCLLDGLPVPLPDGLERFLPEEVQVEGREVYLHLPGGVGRSKLAQALSRGQGDAGTMRSWRTITKLLAIVDAR